MSSHEPVDENDVLDTFAQQADPTEPLTVEDVIDATGGDRAVVSARLRSLTETGLLRSKQVAGGTRVWWPSSSTGERAARPENPARDDRDESAVLDAEQVLGASPTGVVVVTDSGEISFANGRAEAILGLERDDITDRTYRQPEWNIYYGDGTPIPVADHPVTRVFETGVPVYGFEHWIEIPDGTERWLSSNAAPMLNDDGEVESVVVGIENATPLKEREEKLTSEECRVLELSSEALFRPFLDAADGDARIGVDHVGETADGTTLKYVTATGLSPNALAEGFRQRSGVRDVRLLGAVADEVRLELHVTGPTVSLAFDDFGGAVVSLLETRADGSPVLTAELPGDVTPRDAVDAAREAYADIELVSQRLRYSPRLLYDAVEDELTERQSTALQTAYYAGYFDTPRTITGDELASRLGITRQTFHSHLRKAERRLLARLFDGSPETTSD